MAMGNTSANNSANNSATAATPTSPSGAAASTFLFGAQRTNSSASFEHTTTPTNNNGRGRRTKSTEHHPTMDLAAVAVGSDHTPRAATPFVMSPTHRSSSSGGRGGGSGGGGNGGNEGNGGNGDGHNSRRNSVRLSSSPSYTTLSRAATSLGNKGKRINQINPSNPSNPVNPINPINGGGHNNNMAKTIQDRYAMVSGGARRAPSIDQLKPWTVQTEAEIQDNYVIDPQHLLGEGTYSRVYGATHRELGGLFAAKCIEKQFLVSEEEKQSLKREVELHLRLHHPHIVRLYEVYENDCQLWLVMECTGGATMATNNASAVTKSGTLSSLCDYSGRIASEELACKLIHQVLKAVRYLHMNGVLHSDIKPDNIVVDRPNGDVLNTSKTPTMKLCDFGLAKKVPDVKYFKYTKDVHKVPFTGVCGTPGYIAPELLQRQPYGIGADMWSIGIILYELISGRPPFRPAARCLERPVAFEGLKWRTASPEVIDLVRKLLVVDAGQRMTAKEALKHVWFNKFGVGWMSEPRVM